MTITTEEQLEKLKAIGRICAITRDAMASAMRVGMTTGELDEIGAKLLAEHGAQSAPILTYARRLVPFGERPRLRAWHGRLMARPSFRRALEDAAPFGDLMPAPPAVD